MGEVTERSLDVVDEVRKMLAGKDCYYSPLMAPDRAALKDCLDEIESLRAKLADAIAWGNLVEQNLNEQVEVVREKEAEIKLLKSPDYIYVKESLWKDNCEKIMSLDANRAKEEQRADRLQAIVDRVQRLTRYRMGGTNEYDPTAGPLPIQDWIKASDIDQALKGEG